MSQNQGIFDVGLAQKPANFQALTPLSFLGWAEEVYGARTAVIHGDIQFTYSQFAARCRLLASALTGRGIGQGDTVSLMSPNTPPMLEAHYGVPMIGAVLNSLNYRLDASTIAFILDHGESKVIITDREFSPVVSEALSILDRDIIVIDIDDPLAKGGELIGEKDYEALLEEGDPTHPITMPKDEWQAICLNYTSGTTGNPKGVLYTHRSTVLHTMMVCMSDTLGLRSVDVVLPVVPMFHANSWGLVYGAPAAGSAARGVQGRGRAGGGARRDDALDAGAGAAADRGAERPGGAALGDAAALARGVSRTNIAGIWVAFFSRCQRYSCGQAPDGTG